MLLDADLKYAPDDIPRFLALLDDGWDVVAGRKVGHYDKRLVSGVYNGLARRLFGVPVQDLNAMKALRRELLSRVALRYDWHRYLVVVAHARGHGVTQVEVALHPRHAGTSKFASRRRILVGAGDLLVVWFYLRFSAKPAQLFAGAGAALGALGVLVGLVAEMIAILRGEVEALRRERDGG